MLLANDELKQTVSGATVEIDTPLGTTVPMRFGRDGLVSAEAGVLAPVLGSAKDRGRWWVDGDKLCTKWFRWFDAGVRCLTIRLDGTRVHWHKIDDGETGTGTLIASAEPKGKPAAVVAKADPPPEAKPAPQAKPSPSTAAAPSPEKRGTRLAGPPREVADEPSAPPASAKTDAPAAPTEVASADAKPAASQGALEDGPTMRFGGVGLLDASTFSTVGTPVTDTLPPGASKEAASAQAEPRKTLPPAKAAPSYSVASGPSGKKAAVQRQASLDTSAAARRSSEKRAAKARDAAVTSSSRSVALYRVTGVAGYDVLNVRRGPSEEHVSIASIPPTGRRVEITGECREAWCPIRYGGITGWVNSYYLAEEGSREDKWSGASGFAR